ncbi:sperm tail-domain-containing protein [Zopfochytrium polystomum]|nr:sperm tail-domain-containing protein [Zopfochytrium polystomum]
MADHAIGSASPGGAAADGSSSGAHRHSTSSAAPTSVALALGAGAAANGTAATGAAAASVPPTGGLQDASREARIAARKLRIDANRRAKAKPDKVDDSAVRRKPKAEPEQKDVGKAKIQIQMSSKRIDTTKLSSTEIVTNVRVGVIARESVRRVEESKKVEIWKKKKADEADTAEDISEKVAEQWDKLMKTEGPYELFETLTGQKELCDSYIASKNRLINEYMQELKSKDDDYVKELKRQSEEIDTLLQRMEEQYRTFQTTLREELEQIEKSFVEERTELLESDSKELGALLNQRRQNEGKYMVERSERMEDHIKQLEALRVRDAEEYNLVKIKIETDIQVLEQQLQQMRATYQLNTEKLEYNFQVLKKREEENATILGTQKRKITRLTDHLNMLKTKMGKQEKSFQQEYLSLTDDYKRITEQYKELQKKFRHFQVADSKKYRDVWKMNDEIAKELMRKVLQADRIIHEQQLGMKWVGPSEDLFKYVDPITLFKQGSATADQADIVTGTLSIQGLVNSGAEPERQESLAAKMKEHKGYTKTIKRMLELLCNEAGFLVEDKLQKLLTPLHKDEQSLMKLDSIFKALGVETVEDIERLTSYFVAREGDATLRGEEDHSQSNLIHPNDVVKAIRRFVEDHHHDKSALAAGSNVESRPAKAQEEQEEFVVQAGVVSDDATAGPTATAPNLRREYWAQMANVIEDKNYRVWTAVYAAMEKYHAQLSERWHLTQDIKAVSQQNEELKGLLRQYMAAKVNEELQVPPTQIMLAQAGMLRQ